MKRTAEMTLETPIVHAWTADDGWVLRVYDFSPRDQPVRGIVVLGHAMMVDAQTLCRSDRATVAATFVGLSLIHI